jgi:menaquinone-9 beta-reductase
VTELVRETEVAIVGGGVAGTATAVNLSARGIDVVLLERMDAFADICRGEWLTPWGTHEAHRLGVADALVAVGAWEIREWVKWDEVSDPQDPAVVDMTSFIPDIGGPLSFRHHLACERMAAMATATGATVIMGATKSQVTAGPRPSVSFTKDGQRHTINARLVIGACGRAGVVGRQIGVTYDARVHHWGAGMPIRNLADWPMDVQAMGTEDRVNFMVFPQGFGQARLYLNFPTEDRMRYKGPDGAEQFLRAFDVKCLPYRENVLASEIDGPMVVWPSVATKPIGNPMAEGVVLVGDEAGVNDSVLGTGLSSAFRDARMVCDLIVENDDWSQKMFLPYCEERTLRLNRLQFAAEIICQLQCEFGPEAMERRRRARQMMTENSAMQVLELLSMVPHEQVPEFGYSEFFADRLLGVGPGQFTAPMSSMA